MSKYTAEELRRIKTAAYLIEPPAAEVIGGLCDEIIALRQRITMLEDFYLRSCTREDALNKRIEELEEERLWIPTSARLPEDSYWVIVDNGDEIFPAYYDPDCGGWSDAENLLTREPILWMELPAPAEDRDARKSN